MSISERVTSWKPFNQRVRWCQRGAFGCSSVLPSCIVGRCAYLGEEGNELDISCVVVAKDVCKTTPGICQPVQNQSNYAQPNSEPKLNHNQVKLLSVQQPFSIPLELQPQETHTKSDVQRRVRGQVKRGETVSGGHQ